VGIPRTQDTTQIINLKVNIQPPKNILDRIQQNQQIFVTSQSIRILAIIKTVAIDITANRHFTAVQLRQHVSMFKQTVMIQV
jgi:hypothetical protein